MFARSDVKSSLIKMKEIVVDGATVSSVTSKRIQQSVVVKVPQGLLKDENFLQQEFVHKLLAKIAEGARNDLSSIHHDIIIASQNAVITGNLLHESIGQQLYLEIIPDENLNVELEKLNKSHLALLDDITKLEQQIKNFEEQLKKKTMMCVDASWSRFEHIPSDDFQKRNDLWGILDKRFAEQQSGAVALTGLGGMGKSSLALHWGYTQKNNRNQANASGKRYEHIRWMKMDSISQKESLECWAKDLKIVVGDKTTHDILVAIAEKIQESTWLLIWDNVENYASIELWIKYLPKNTYQQILITTRDDRSCWTRPIKVGAFEPLEALAYIHDTIKMLSENIAWDEGLAIVLASRLGYHPLALELALGQITYYDIPLDIYIAQLSLSLDSLNEKNKMQGLEQLSNYTIDTLWQMELKNLSFEATQLLRFISFIYPDNIRKELLDNFQNDSSCSEALDVLRAQSFVKKIISLSVEQWSLHRLLQEVVRKQSLLDYQFSLAGLLNKGLLAFEKTYAEKQHEDDILRCQEAVIHAETWLSYASFFSSTISNSEINYWKIQLLLHLGRIQRVLALYTQAQETLTKIFQLPIIHSALFRHVYAKLCLEQGILFYYQGRFLEAKNYLQLALPLAEALSLPIAFVVEIRYMLGMTLLKEGHTLSAQQEFKRSLNIYCTAYGEKPDFYIANILCRLGDTYLQNNLTEAYKCYKQALDMNYKVYGEKIDHPSTAATLHAIGDVYRLQGQQSEAWSYFMKSLKMKYAVYGQKTNHSNIAATLHKLGEVCFSFNDYTSARLFCIESLSMKRIVYGESVNHPSIAITLELLGDIYVNLNDTTLSLKHYHEALIMFKALSLEKYAKKINILEEKIYSNKVFDHASTQKIVSSNLNIWISSNHFTLFTAVGIAAVGVGAIAWRFLSKK